eukprot:6038732-Alexandrium_andersonii.AAC.1
MCIRDRDPASQQDRGGPAPRGGGAAGHRQGDPTARTDPGVRGGEGLVGHPGPPLGGPAGGKPAAGCAGRPR